MNKIVFHIVLAAIIAAALFFIYKKFSTNTGKEYLLNLGFGEVIIDKLTPGELNAVVTYLKTPTNQRIYKPGSQMDKLLLSASNKTNIIYYI